MADVRYWKYWDRKKLLREACPHFPLVKGGVGTSVSEAEQLWLNKVKSSQRLLEIGAGDLSNQEKLNSVGFLGQYESLDIGDEFQYTYKTWSEVQGMFNGILLLDVIEHLPLTEGLELSHECHSRLQNQGVLIVQTPNARSIRSPLSTDMTHVQGYNIQDLWAYLTLMGFQVQGHRVQFLPERMNIFYRIRYTFARWIITRILGLDYADNILLIAQRNQS